MENFTWKFVNAPVTITLYHKNYRTDLSATMCSVNAHVFRYNCGLFFHTSYLFDQNSITYDMIVTPEMCRLAWNSWTTKITSFDEIFDVPIDFDLKTQSNFNDAQAHSSTIKCTSSQIKHYTFETSMQRVNITYNYGIERVSNEDRRKSPCLLTEGGCKTTMLDSFAYTWDTPEKCVMTKCCTIFWQRIKRKLNSSSSVQSTTLEREWTYTQSFHCKLWAMWKTWKLYKRNFESLFVNYGGGFAMLGGELRTKEQSSNAY